MACSVGRKPWLSNGSSAGGRDGEGSDPKCLAAQQPTAVPRLTWGQFKPPKIKMPLEKYKLWIFWK
jgi:hypothetical protein